VYGQDAHGSTRLLTDASGAVTDTYAYDAFGGLAGRTGTSENDHLFAGERLDRSLGLYDLRARDYDPALARFVERDSLPGRLREPTTLNRYAYANDEPVNFVDPTGHFGQLVDVLAGLQLRSLVGVTLDARTKIKAFCEGKGRLQAVIRWISSAGRDKVDSAGSLKPRQGSRRLSLNFDLNTSPVGKLGVSLNIDNPWKSSISYGQNFTLPLDKVTKNSALGATLLQVDGIVRPLRLSPQTYTDATNASPGKALVKAIALSFTAGFEIVFFEVMRLQYTLYPTDGVNSLE
jgi:RHS repeat-associated protein